mmetsp:Transcript_11325/g.26680  ORF Transcript_11325/g.26680 Transcript_11325/m.26680 type:complete len:289 (+) Transcript_11325:60-926(+)
MPRFSLRHSLTPKSSTIPIHRNSSEQGSIRRNRSFLGRMFGRSSSNASNPGSDDSQSSRQPILEYSLSPTLPPPPRRGMTFCGLCDNRIATVLLNSIHMIVAIVMELRQALEWGNRNYRQEPPILLLLVLVFSFLGMFGGLQFDNRAIVVSTIGLCALCWVYFIEMYVFGLILICFIVFVQVILAMEIRRGIMTRETYATEQYIDRDGRKAIQKVHGLSVEIGETAKEFKHEVKIAYKKKKSKVLGKKKKKKTQEEAAPAAALVEASAASAMEVEAEPSDDENEGEEC